jgi:hypothetical protein
VRLFYYLEKSMALKLPNGTKFFISTALDVAKHVTAVTTANPAVATAAAHGLANGAPVLFQSGWEDATGSVFQIGGVTEDSFTFLEAAGLDTTDTTKFLPGGGVGTIQTITGWVEIQQIAESKANGGEAQFTDVDLLSRDNAVRLPNGFSARSFELTVADDITLDGYKRAKHASDQLEKVVLKMAMRSGDVGYSYGYVSVNDVPTMDKGKVSSIKMVFTVDGKFTRYTKA